MSFFQFGRWSTISIVVLILGIYYWVYQRRHFIWSNSGKECVTIWQQPNNKCYVIPYKYVSPFTPSSNFILTKNYRNYIGILFNTNDNYHVKISIYNEFKKNGLDDKVAVYALNDSLLFEYGMLKQYNVDLGLRETSMQADSLELLHDYSYIDLNRIYGIKVWKPVTY